MKTLCTSMSCQDAIFSKAECTEVLLENALNVWTMLDQVGDGSRVADEQIKICGDERISTPCFQKPATGMGGVFDVVQEVLEHHLNTFSFRPARHEATNTKLI